MSSRAVKTFIVLLCLLALAVPTPATFAAGETPTPSTLTPSAGASVSIETNPTDLPVGETALVSVRLNEVPVEGYKSAEFTCTYDGALVEKSNIAVTDLFGAEPVVAIHDPQTGTFIVAIAGANSNRAMTGGTAFTFSAKGLQAGQSAVQCAARISKGDNLAIDVPSTGAILTILDAGVSPTPSAAATVTPGGHEHPTAVSTAPGSPTPVPNGSLSGQIVASKPVTLHLFDADQVEITSAPANPDGTFSMTPLPGEYTLVATASGFLSHQGPVTITAGSPTVFPAASLLAGDVDGNEVIDQFDALTIGMSYASSTPEAADLNNDAVIDFLDLELLAENYRQTGPTGTSSPIEAFLQKIKPTAIGSPVPDPKKTVIAPTAVGSPGPGPKETPIAPSTTATQTTGTTGAGAPFPDAPFCPTHDPAKWHGLWDSVRGCHYDHEHGNFPFTPDVAAAFPGFDLRALLCGVEIGHCVPSGPMEHTHKHGGFKWNVLVGHPHGCQGHEGSTIGIDASAVQYHAFGDYSIEFGTRIHSALAMMRQCRVENPGDYGYVFIDQHVDYGQRVSAYQGLTLPYPDNPSPAYPSGLAPYFTIDCIFCGSKTDTRQAIVDTNNNASSTWTSAPQRLAGGSSLFEILFRVRDTYQVLDHRNLAYPFTFVWLCSNDEGLTYAAQAGCRYNNSTTSVHEVNGTIPAAWDNLPGFDTNPATGRITASGYVTHSGEWNQSCVQAGPDCHPIKLVNAFVGYYGSFLLAGKEGQFMPVGAPERDIYFCAGVPCRETDAGAISSGWIGAEN